MGKFSDWRKAKAAEGASGYGLSKWFQVMGDRFMPMFLSGLLAMGCMTPACICLFLYMGNQNLASLLGAVLGFGLGAPALVSLFFICMQAIRDNPTWVWDSFKNAYVRESRKAMPLGLLVAVLWTVYLQVAGTVLAGGVVSIVTLVLLVAAGIFLAGFSFFSFQQLATVELSFPQILGNGLLLVLAGKGRSLAVSVLTLAAIGIGMWFFLFSYFILLLGLLFVLVMTGELIFYPVFESLFLGE